MSTGNRSGTTGAFENGTWYKPLKHHTFTVAVEHHSLRFARIEEAVKNLQTLVQQTQSKERSGTEMLFEMRRAEFAKEQGRLGCQPFPVCK